MTWQAWTVAAVVLAVMALFVSEKLRFDVIALLALVVLLVVGILTPAEGLSGFSNEATVVVAAMFALNAGVVHTGGLDPLIRALSKIRRPWLLTLAIMLVVCVLGAFVKNTALVATFLPVVLNVCARTKTPASRVLMPMAFAAQMGGVCTLLGTSSNLLTNSLAIQHGMAGFGVFEFTKLGAILAVAGIAYMMLIGRWLLPSHTETAFVEEFDRGKFVTELRVASGSPLIGQSVADAKLGEKYAVYVLELLRGEEHLWAPRAQMLAEGDVLLTRGDWPKLEDFRQEAKLEIAHAFDAPVEGNARNVIVETVVTPNARIVGQRVGDIEMSSWSGRATVLAIHRRNQVIREQIKLTKAEVGDLLIMMVEESGLQQLRRDPDLVILSERGDARESRRRAPIAVAILIAVVVIAGLGILPIVVSALAGVVAMAVTRCLSFEDVYESMDWKIIILLGAVLPLGIALDKSGLAQHLVDAGMRLVGPYGPVAVLATVYLLSAILTELMGHNPSVVLLVPIAIAVARAMHASPIPFAITVAFAAATSFATPVGYPTNTMIYGAGGYRFTDFMKVGIPLILLFWMLSIWLVPRFWPLMG